MSLEAGHRLGDHETLGLLGARGKGEVYRARDRRLDREGAIKVLPDGDRLLALSPGPRSQTIDEILIVESWLVVLRRKVGVV